MSNLDFVTLAVGSAHVRVATRPITIAEYRGYLRATGEKAPARLPGLRDWHSPVVYVSQVEAGAFCRWLGSEDHQAYRLPSVAEFLQLAGSAGEEGVDEGIWPGSAAEGPQAIAAAHHGIYLCEWTREIETLPTFSGGEPRVLGSVFYPPWLREGNNAKQVQGMMQAGQGYSFVSFRVACAD